MFHYFVSSHRATDRSKVASHTFGCAVAAGSAGIVVFNFIVLPTVVVTFLVLLSWNVSLPAYP